MLVDLVFVAECVAKCCVLEGSLGRVKIRPMQRECRPVSLTPGNKCLSAVTFALTAHASLSLVAIYNYNFTPSIAER